MINGQVSVFTLEYYAKKQFCFSFIVSENSTISIDDDYHFAVPEKSIFRCGKLSKTAGLCYKLFTLMKSVDFEILERARDGSFAPSSISRG